ncbi:MAG: hypothetical protein U1B80_05435, partial [Anaerolineaceae bacterium]|nr:hypothetical protein [Anaerolineaceae bacterium]
MNTIETHSRQTLSRGTFLKILNAAIKSRSYRFARELAVNWLSIFSGDLEVIRLLAKVQFGEGNRVQAVTLSERICKLDPEFKSAHEDLALYAKDVFSDIAAGARACAYALGTDVAQGDRLPEWAYKLREVREAVQAGLLQEAEEQIHEVLGLNLDLALPTVVHLGINLQQVDPLTINHLASIYHARWQDCLQFALALAQSQLDIHSEPNAVSLLHHCVANDAAGQVACRMWGANHRLISLWHDRMAIDLNMGIPSEVMIELGWNLLPAGMAGMAAVPKEGIYGTGQKSETTPATNGFDVETKDGEATTAPHLEGNSMEAAQAVAAHTPPPINASEPMTGSQSIDHQVRRHPGARDKRLEAIAQEFERLAKKLNRPGLAG